MLLVDSRAGSAELVVPLRRLGLPVNPDPVILPYGDVAFEGRGVGGKPVSIGVEFKTVTDLVQSFRTDRLAGHQLDIVNAYDYAWLLVEGERRIDDSGHLVTQTRRRVIRLGMTLDELEKRLLTLQYTGLYLKEVTRRWHTLRFLQSLYRGWTDRNLDDHRSHIAVHRPLAAAQLSPFRQAVSTWPHIGIRTSLMVERAFEGSLRRAANAPAAVWADIKVNLEGRKLGMKCATDVVRFLGGD